MGLLIGLITLYMNAIKFKQRLIIIFLVVNVNAHFHMGDTQ